MPEMRTRESVVMSAKAKNKTKNNETTLAEAVAVASVPAVEGAPPVIETTATEAPTTETAAKPSLLLRARVATGKAVVTVFATVRTAQTTAVKKSLAWITAADTGLSKSLLASEQFLLSRLKIAE
jgi:hypothetical protein